MYNLLGLAVGPEPIKFVAPVFVSCFAERGCRMWETVDIFGKQSL